VGHLRSSAPRCQGDLYGGRVFRALLAGTALAVACAGSPPTPEPKPRPKPHAASAPAPPRAVVDMGKVDRVALGTAKRETLTFTVHAVPGRRAAMLVSADLLQAYAHVRRVDATGQLGPVRSLAGRQPVGMFDAVSSGASSSSLLLSSDGQRLCVEALDKRANPQCRAVRADAAVALAGKPVLLEARAEGGDDSSADVTNMRLWVHRVEANGIAETPKDSGLTFVQPLPGMGLADAVGLTSGARVLYYDQRTPRSKGRKRTARAALESATLDKEGKLVAGSEMVIFEGDRRQGVVDEHHGPRLFAAGDRAIYLGRTGEKSTFEAVGFSPRQMVPAPAAACIADPWRLLDAKPEIQILERIAALKPKLSEHQSSNDAARLAWAGDWGYFVRAGELVAVDRAGHEQTLPAPFEARRARLFWGAMSTAGEGVALTSDGLVEVKGDRTRSMTNGHHEIFGAPVRIAASWWTQRPNATGGEIARLSPPGIAPGLAAYADASRLVGGNERGMFIELRGGRLLVSEIDPDGATRALGAHASPVGVGFEAVAREGGGALIVGPKRGARAELVAFALDARGGMGRAQPLRALEAPLSFVDLPGGGLVIDRRRTTVVWLDPDGRERARHSWPESDSGAACIDGVPLRAELPAIEPGTFARVPLLALADRCMLGMPRWFADGTLRWFGTKVSGLDSQAELVTVAGPAATSQGVRAQPTAPPNNQTASEPCPPDMVLVNGQFCIDRFESQLVDASTGLTLSPDYATSPHFARLAIQGWDAGRWFAGDLHARAMPLPPLMRAVDAAPKVAARSRAGVRPSGYTSGLVAEDACKGAGKRLCKHEEWVTACRGQDNRKFPYGDDYQQGVCNVYRYAHPAASLHGNAAVGHHDPRLNRVTDAGAPLLRLTGATPRCASRWGDDAVYDMVGNLDEWVEVKKGGGFAGAFYSRLSKNGCESLITAHPKRYLDYSLGTRCCLSAKQ